MNKKSITQTKLEELNLEKIKVAKELQIWTEKLNKAEKYSEVLYETRRFTVDFWDERIKEARKKVEQESSTETKYWWLEHETRQRTEFGIYYEALELFDKRIKKEIEIIKDNGRRIKRR